LLTDKQKLAENITSLAEVIIYKFIMRAKSASWIWGASSR